MLQLEPSDALHYRSSWTNISAENPGHGKQQGEEGRVNISPKIQAMFNMSILT